MRDLVTGQVELKSSEEYLEILFLCQTNTTFRGCLLDVESHSFKPNRICRTFRLRD